MYACECIPSALPIYYFQYVQFEKQAIHGRINTKIKATKEIRRHAEIRFTMSLHYNRCLARKKYIYGYGNNVYVFLRCVFAIWMGWIDGKTPLITSRLALMHWTWRESAEQWQENGQDPRPSPTTSTTNTTTCNSIPKDQPHIKAAAKSEFKAKASPDNFDLQLAIQKVHPVPRHPQPCRLSHETA